MRKTTLNLTMIGTGLLAGMAFGAGPALGAPAAGPHGVATPAAAAVADCVPGAGCGPIPLNPSHVLVIVLDGDWFLHTLATGIGWPMGGQVPAAGGSGTGANPGDATPVSPPPDGAVTGAGQTSEPGCTCPGTPVGTGSTETGGNPGGTTDTGTETTTPTGTTGTETTGTA